MKCVKFINGEVMRVSDQKAEELVLKGAHTYTNKEEWKKGGRK